MFDLVYTTRVTEDNPMAMKSRCMLQDPLHDVSWGRYAGLDILRGEFEIFSWNPIERLRDIR